MNKVSLALLGEKISHSKSKEMYEKILNREIDYTLIDVKKDDIPSLDEIFSFAKGLSVTSPHKKAFLKEVQLDEDIKVLNAINCIKKIDNFYYGTNTDYLALQEIIPNIITENNISSVVILGSGSMATITKKILDYLRQPYEICTRKQDGDISNIDLRDKDSQLLVINSCSREYTFKGKLDQKTIFFDYNYSFFAHAHIERQCQYIDGLRLLLKQAEIATDFWGLSR